MAEAVVDGTNDGLNGVWDVDDEAVGHEADEDYVEVSEDLYWDVDADGEEEGEEEEEGERKRKMKRKNGVVSWEYGETMD